MAGGAVGGLEVRLEPGSGAFPVEHVAAVLSEPATDVLGVDLTAAVEESLAGDGTACACARPIPGGALSVEGDPTDGYRLAIEGP